MTGNSKSMSGTWIPAYVPQSSLTVSILIVFSSIITSTTFGYDGSMLNGLNILPSYTDYFNLNPATEGLQTASIFIGGCLAGVSWGSVTDKIGRRPSLFWAALITIVAIFLQTAAQNTAMFVVARVIVGFGTCASGVAGPVYLAETLPLHWRGWGLGLLNDFYYGGLIAAGVTYGTAKIDSTWAWRIPSAIQGLFSIICIVIIPFIPESPRWLAFTNKPEMALAVVAQTYASGDSHSPIVLAAYKQIIETIQYEKNVAETLSVVQLFKTPSARKRVLLAMSAAIFSVIAGNVIASYFLGNFLVNAGITNTTTQLQINVILNAWCLVCSLAGTVSVDKWGRKPTAVVCTIALTVFLFIVGALTKVYGSSTNHSGIYGAVAAIFLFQGAYSFGWTPLLYLYPPEVLNYSIRSTGLGLFQFSNNGIALLIVFTMPIAITNLGWKTYMINAGWDVLMIAAIMYWWVETKGRTLEELDEEFEGKKHSDAPDLEKIYKGKERVDIQALEVNEKN